MNDVGYVADILGERFSAWCSLRLADVKAALYDLLCTRTDSMQEILDALQRAKSQLVGAEDCAWWRTDSGGYLREFAFLKRLTRPMCLAVVLSKDDLPTMVTKLNFSFLDLLVRIQTVQDTVADALLMRACILDRCCAESDELRDLQQNMLKAGVPLLKSKSGLDSIAMTLETAPQLEKQLRELLMALNREMGPQGGSRLSTVCNSKTLIKTWSRRLGNQFQSIEAKSTISGSASKELTSKSYDEVLRRRKELIANHKKLRTRGHSSRGGRLTPMRWR